MLAPLVGRTVLSRGPLVCADRCPAVSANAWATGVGARRSAFRTTFAKSYKLGGEARSQRLEPPVSSGSESKTVVGNHPFFVVALQASKVCRDGRTQLPAGNGPRQFIPVARCDEALARAPPLVLHECTLGHSIA
jgi:hypothetical protein